jgi:hypothetical protein
MVDRLTLRQALDFLEKVPMGEEGVTVREDEGVMEVTVSMPRLRTQPHLLLRGLLVEFRDAFASVLEMPFSHEYYDQLDRMARKRAGKAIEEVLKGPLYRAQLPLVIGQQEQLFDAIQTLEKLLPPATNPGH